MLLVAVIIAGHSALGYAGFKAAWPYQNVWEVRLGAVSQAILALPVLPAVLFAMGLFFLISGLVTPGSVAHKGPRRFARDRLVTRTPARARPVSLTMRIPQRSAEAFHAEKHTQMYARSDPP